MNYRHSKRLEAIHEELGNAYLDTMKKNGIGYPPPVAWTTVPPVPEGRTSAIIFGDDQDIEVWGVPRDMLVSVVVFKAMGICIMAPRN